MWLRCVPYDSMAYSWHWPMKNGSVCGWKEGRKTCGIYETGTHFTKHFYITIQIWWKFHLAVIQLLVIISQQNFTHAMTAQLSSCAKFCSDHLIGIWMRAKWNFHHIWIVMEKLWVKWSPGKQNALLVHFCDVTSLSCQWPILRLTPYRISHKICKWFYCAFCWGHIYGF